MTTTPTPTSTRWTGLRMDPLDVLFFRDGRPFENSIRNAGGLPTPRTLAGALRTAMLRQAGKLDEFLRDLRVHKDPRKAAEVTEAPTPIINARFRGPWLARTTQSSGGGSVEPLVPAPPNLFRDGETILRADPADPMPGWKGLTPKPLWLGNQPDIKTAGGFLTPAGLRAYLEGRVPTPADLLAADTLYDFDQRTGIVVNPERLTAEESQIYSVRLLALQRNVCFYAEMTADAPAPAGPVPFGGEGRHVNVIPLNQPFAWPTPQITSERRCWLLITPGLFGAWKPPGIDCVSAAVGNPLAVSGWDNAAGPSGGPRPTRYAAPAGSAYFVQSTSASAPNLLRHFGDDTNEGWGLALPGTWNPFIERNAR